MQEWPWDTKNKLQDFSAELLVQLEYPGCLSDFFSRLQIVKANGDSSPSGDPIIVYGDQSYISLADMLEVSSLKVETFNSDFANYLKFVPEPVRWNPTYRDFLLCLRSCSLTHTFRRRVHPRTRTARRPSRKRTFRSSGTIASSSTRSGKNCAKRCANASTCCVGTDRSAAACRVRARRNT